jgi:hypothetical protein
MEDFILVAEKIASTLARTGGSAFEPLECRGHERGGFAGRDALRLVQWRI